MNLSVVIVSWNVCDKLRSNLKAIYNNTQNINFEVFIIDNNSQDNTVEMVEEEFPQIKLIKNKENLGFAKANNQVLEEIKGKYILFLNPDMKVKKGTLEGIVKWMDKHPKAGIAGCRLVDENGAIVPHVRRFPTVWDQLAIILKIPHFLPNILNKYLMKNFDYSHSASVDSIRGSFFITRKEIIEKIGCWDERYFIWFEDVDFCKRVKKAGWKIMYTPVVECIDYMGQSFKQVKRGKTQIYFRNSMLKYFKKWHPIWQYFLLFLAWPIGFLMAVVAEKLNLKSKGKT